MPKVFISYRREDSQHQADRIFDALKRVVPKRDLFIDIDGIPAGVDFVEHLNSQVEKCDVLLALIGPEWISTTSAGGKRRLDDPGDFVRIEIAAALKRGIKVAPVLLDGAVMPQQQELPDDLAELSRRNAIEIRRNSFEGDTGRMIDKLGLRETRSRVGAIAAWVGGIVVVVGLAAAALFAWNGENEKARLAVEAELQRTRDAKEAADAEAAMRAYQLAEAQAREKAALSEPGSGDEASTVSATKPAETPVVAPALKAPVVACTDCPPLSRVKLSSGKTIEASAPITLGDWRLYCASAACGEWDSKREAALPLTSVNWTMANQYVTWLSARMGRKLRLPTVAEAEGLTAEPPQEEGMGYSEWTSTCHGGSAAACTDYEVRGWDAKNRRVADWHGVTAKGSTIGFRVVADGKL